MILHALTRSGILAPALVTGLALGCGPGRPLADPPPEGWFQHPVAPIGFAVPADWRSSIESTAGGSALVFAGPSSDRGAYAPITFRLVPNDDASLDEQLERILAAAALHPRFRHWGAWPVVAGGRCGLAYGLELEHHESRQWQQAVLLPVGDLSLHLALSAVPEHFTAGVPVFERLLATLVIGDVNTGCGAGALW